MNRFCCIILVLILLTGCNAQENSSGQRLFLGTKPEDTSFTHLPADYFQGNSDSALRYSGVSEVTIILDGKEHPLEEAIVSGLVAPEEIRAWAAMDARNGFCQLEAHSRNGLSYLLIEDNQDTTFAFRMDTLDEFTEALPSGKYKIILEIMDQFDEDQLHPLMSDYNRNQLYYVYFEIP